jgi:transposase-like protein
MAMMGKIRSMHFRQGKSISEIARLTSLSRNTVKKWLKAPQGAEPKYRRREMPTKLAPFVEALHQALKADGHRPRRERRTARALHVELQALGYEGGYERTSVMITTNLTFGEWAAVFGDAKMTTALLDRLTHHCHIVETGNESYRFRHSSATAKTRIKAREQARRAKPAPDAEPF